MSVSDPVERTITYATTVDDLTAALAFLMSRMDDVGPDPSMTINPVWSSGDDFTGRRFEVSVSGMTADEKTGTPE